ncbi:MAG TPA: 30S ribosome-binding factor RbfA [Thiotrichales bacterium]|nr:30S ribosome-binding factor RbfA [Thiotrichales bacterium]
MPREFSRSQRMAEQLRRELAEIVRSEIKDPRLGFSSFTEVRVSRDLSHAVVYCSVLNPEQADETLATLNRASGFIRKLIAGRIHARIVPTLKFVLDDSMTRGAEMDDLIRQAVDRDRATHRDEEQPSEADDTGKSDSAGQRGTEPDN